LGDGAKSGFGSAFVIETDPPPGERRERERGRERKRQRINENREG
jgi:hypothetical protein